MSIVSHIKRQRNTLDLLPDDPLQLLHISDLHFGSTQETKTLATMGDADIHSLCSAIKRELKKNGENSGCPHLVVVTGDIGDTGHPGDYEKAFEWFKKLAAQFDWTLPNPRFLIVPGNHDFSIPLCAADHIKLKRDAEKPLELLLDTSKGEKSRLAAYAMLPFSEFVTRVCGNRHLQTGNPDAYSYPLMSWVEHGFSEYGVVFSGFNTSCSHDENSWPRRYVDDKEFAFVNKRLEKLNNTYSNASRIFHIALSHHSLVRHDGAKNEISNYADCKKCFFKEDFYPELLLHGHEHKRDAIIYDGKCLVVTAPTPTKKEETTGGNDTNPCGIIFGGVTAFWIRSVRR